jgi:hypothetical protein
VPLRPRHDAAPARARPSFRPPPLNNNTSIAVEAGIASNNIQVTSDNSQQFQPDFIQGGGEFMPGIFANDILDDKSYSAF